MKVINVNSIFYKSKDNFLALENFTQLVLKRFIILVLVEKQRKNGKIYGNPDF